MPWKPPPPAPKCPTCNQSVFHAEKVVGPGGIAYHAPCLICSLCRRRLDSTLLAEHDGQLLCAHCHRAHLGTGSGHFNTAVPLRPQLPQPSARSPPLSLGIASCSPRARSPPQSAGPALSDRIASLSLAKQQVLEAVGDSSAPQTQDSAPTAALSLDDVIAAGTMPRIISRSQATQARTQPGDPQGLQGQEQEREQEVKPSLPPRPPKPSNLGLNRTVTPPAPAPAPAPAPKLPARPTPPRVSTPTAPKPAVDARADDHELSAAEVIARVRAGRAAGSLVPSSESEGPSTSGSRAVPAPEWEDPAPARSNPATPPRPSEPPAAPARPSQASSGLPPPRRADPAALRRGGGTIGSVPLAGTSSPSIGSVAVPVSSPRATFSGVGVVGRGAQVAQRAAQATSGTPLCARCEKAVYHAEHVYAASHKWHRACLKCDGCGSTLDPGKVTTGPADAAQLLADLGWSEADLHAHTRFCNVWCPHCFAKYFGPRGTKVGMSLPAREYRRF